MSVRRLVLPLFLCLAASLATAAPAAAHHGHPSPPAHARCLPVDATGVGQDLGGGQTTATITGVDGTVASFVGPIVFTGLGGTLTAQVTGTLDVTTGVFTSTSTSVTGTGLLRRVTGDLTFTGTEDLTTGAFTEAIHGRLCVAHGH